MKHISLTRYQAKIDNYIFYAFDACLSGLPIYRILFALGMLIMTRSQQYSWMAPFPDTFFAPPPGLTMFFRGFPPDIVFYALDFLTLLANICLLLGYRTRVASISFALLMILGNAWFFSFGKINHTILVVLVPLVLSASNWGDRLSLDARRDQGLTPRRPSWPLALLAVIIGLGMLSAAIPKILFGWPDLQTQAVQGHLVSRYFGDGRQMVLADYLLSVRSPLLWELLDIGTILFEGLFILAALSRRSMRIFCAVACLFHAGIFFVMGIGFWANLLAYAAFFNFSWLMRAPALRSFPQIVAKYVDQLRGIHIVAISALTFCCYTFIGNPIHVLLTISFGDWQMPLYTGIFGLAAFLGAGFLLRSIIHTIPPYHFQFISKSYHFISSHRHQP